MNWMMATMLTSCERKEKIMHDAMVLGEMNVYVSATRLHESKTFVTVSSNVWQQPWIFYQAKLANYGTNTKFPKSAKKYYFQLLWGLRVYLRALLLK